MKKMGHHLLNVKIYSSSLQRIKEPILINTLEGMLYKNKIRTDNVNRDFFIVFKNISVYNSGYVLLMYSKIHTHLHTIFVV